MRGSAPWRGGIGPVTDREGSAEEAPGTADGTGWFIPLADRPQARTLVFGFPGVGGGPSTLRECARSLPEDLEMWSAALPSRESRFGQPPADDLMSLVTAVTCGLMPHARRPYALFGHCFGALLAFLAAIRLGRSTAMRPIRLIVCGYASPDTPNVIAEQYLRLDSDAFWARIAGLGGFPPGIAAEEFREVFEETFRADYRLIAQYRHMPVTVDVPITVLTAGPGRPSSDLDGWRRCSSRTVMFERVAGVDRFPSDGAAQVATGIAAALAAAG